MCVCKISHLTQRASKEGSKIRLPIGLPIWGRPLLTFHADTAAVQEKSVEFIPGPLTEPGSEKFRQSYEVMVDPGLSKGKAGANRKLPQSGIVT